MFRQNLDHAKEVLLENGFTCVVYNGDRLYTSEYRGVKPLVMWYRQGMDFQGFSAADRVIGKATAFLYVLLGVTAVSAGVISKPAKQVLEDHGIFVEYGTLVPNIINRAKTGLCPFEEAVTHIQDTAQAYRAILKKMEELAIPLSDRLTT